MGGQWSAWGRARIGPAHLKRSSKGLRRKGFCTLHVLRGAEEVGATSIVRVPLRTNRSDLAGPFDVVGDVHGCRAERKDLIVELGGDVVGDDACVHPRRRPIRAVVVTCSTMAAGATSARALRIRSANPSEASFWSAPALRALPR